MINFVFVLVFLISIVYFILKIKKYIYDTIYIEIYIILIVKQYYEHCFEKSSQLTIIKTELETFRVKKTRNENNY